MANIQNSIHSNLGYLCDNLRDVPRVLIFLVEQDIISRDEKKSIEVNTGSEKIYNIFEILEMRAELHWETIRDIFQKTGNNPIIEKIENYVIPKAVKRSGGSTSNEIPVKKSIMLDQWWPECKIMVKSFHPRNHNENLLVEEIKKKLVENKSPQKWGSKLALTGLGGIGKSTVAKWFAHQYENDYDHIMWIECGEESLKNSFRQLAMELRVEDWRDLDLNTQARKCFIILNEKRCLFIYDNAECYEGDKGIRDVLPKFENFHSIITSRNRKWGSETGLGQIVQFFLEGFTIKDSLQFFTKALKPQVSYTEINLLDLCDELGSRPLPLALQIAAATLNNLEIEIVPYINRVKETREIIDQSFEVYRTTGDDSLHLIQDLSKKYEGYCFVYMFPPYGIRHSVECLGILLTSVKIVIFRL